MQALVYTGPHELQVLDIEPQAPAAGEVLISVAACGICGSELEGFASQSPFRVPPLVMGHEFSGRRIDTGELVAVNPLVFCGRCDLCLRGQQNICRNRVIIGIQRPGAFADAVAVPESCCISLPAGMSPLQGAYVEPLANGVHALRLIREHDPLPQRVGVIGVGPLGYAVIAAAVACGVPVVEAADTFSPRRAWAEHAGASSAGERLSGEFDAIVDTVGTADTRAVSAELLRPGGTAVWMGLHGPENTVDGQVLIRTEKRVITSFCYTDSEFRTAVIIASKLKPEWAHEAPLSDGVTAFEELLGRPVPTLKTFLAPQGEAR